MTWRVLLAGSPTGGHLYPGVALATALVESCGCEPHFVTAGTDLDARIIGSRFPVHVVPFGRRQLAAARRKARALIKELQPEALIGLGGMGSVALAAAGLGQRRPLFLLEQNAIVGRANRWLAPVARRVFTSFPDTVGSRWLRRRAVALGCPIRSDFRPSPLPEDERPCLLVQGGSQGAQQINDIVVVALSSLADRRDQFRVVHVTGPGKDTGIAAAYRAAGIEAVVCDYLDDPAQTLTDSSFVIGRAGGSSVAEITAVGRGAAFVPYPHHADRQQFRNAEPVVAAGGAEIVAATSAAVTATLERCFFAADARRQHADSSRSVGIPDAADRIATVVATHLERLPGDHPQVGLVA
ncbi:MAG: glycosyltransferase [Planctomycetota bacterium]